MTTLAADANRVTEIGDVQEYPVIAADIIYEGAAVGLVAGTGHARPLAATDVFVGFAERRCDNSAGAAAAKTVRVRRRGQIQLTVTGAVITDVGQPVYASDDNAFVFNPVAAVFVGFVSRYVAADLAIVDFDAVGFIDPWGEYSVRELLSGTKTFDIEDNGKAFFCDAAADGDALTLPAVAVPVNIAIVNIAAFGASGLQISPDANDKIRGPNLAGTNDKDLINTKATARRGDYVKLVVGDADGGFVSEMRGIWATQG